MAEFEGEGEEGGGWSGHFEGSWLGFVGCLDMTCVGSGRAGLGRWARREETFGLRGRCIDTHVLGAVSQLGVFLMPFIESRNCSR